MTKTLKEIAELVGGKLQGDGNVKISGVNQSDISKIENGTRNPSIRLLQKLAAGMNMSLKLQFIPSC